MQQPSAYSKNTVRFLFWTVALSNNLQATYVGKCTMTCLMYFRQIEPEILNFGTNVLLYMNKLAVFRTKKNYMQIHFTPRHGKFYASI